MNCIVELCHKVNASYWQLRVINPSAYGTDYLLIINAMQFVLTLQKHVFWLLSNLGRSV